MKERRQNHRDIRVQDDKITENTNARSPLALRNLLKLLLTCKAKRRKECQIDIFYKLKYGTSLEVSCSFLVHLPNSRAFAVNNIIEIQNFISL